MTTTLNHAQTRYINAKNDLQVLMMRRDLLNQEIRIAEQRYDQAFKEAQADADAQGS